LNIRLSSKDLEAIQKRAKASHPELAREERPREARQSA
jgi:hypothetical protein